MNQIPVNGMNGGAVLGYWGAPTPTETATSLLCSMKVRAASLKNELANIDGKRRELAKLERMIAAAEAPEEESTES